MKPIEYLYFNIYNQFYRRSYHAQEFYARIQAMYLFSLSAGGWMLFLEAVYLRLIKHSWFSSKPGAMIYATAVYLFTALIFHHIFIVKERDQKIFGKYAERWDRNTKKKRDLLITCMVIVAPYILLGLLARLFPRQL